MRPRFPGLRGRLLLSVLGAIGVVLAALVLVFNLVLRDRLSSEAGSAAQARASAEITALRVADGRILLPEAPDDRNRDILVWVFQAGRALERPASPDNDSAAAALAARAPATRDVSGTDTRLYALPVTRTGHQLGAVVAGVSLEPYEQSRRTALIASVILAAAVLLAVALAARWVIGRALSPVARMTRQAAEWSEHDLDRRFALGPARDELTLLAHTLDGLLDRLAVSFRHEQRLSAEISHELRTPLSSIIAEAQYALRHGEQTAEGRATFEHILQSARQLGRTLDTLLAAARAQLDPRGATSDARSCAEVSASLVREAAPGLDVRVIAQDGARVAVEPELVNRILSPLLENAVRHARRSIQIKVEPEGEMVRFLVEDDGRGVPNEAREAIFEPGQRGATSTVAAAPVATGAGLGLSLCRRLARAAGGDVHAQASDAGAVFVVRLPASS